MRTEKCRSLYLCLVTNKTLQKESDLSAATLQNYQLQLSIIGHQDNQRDLDKPHSGRYAVITLQGLLGHTTPYNENPLHFQITQPIDMVYP